jgi:hypothetical protein
MAESDPEEDQVHLEHHHWAYDKHHFLPASYIPGQRGSKPIHKKPDFYWSLRLDNKNHPKFLALVPQGI